jgi:hypothetical protein
VLSNLRVPQIPRGVRTKVGFQHFFDICSGRFDQIIHTF